MTVSFLEQKRTVRHVFPDVTFSDRLVFTSGTGTSRYLHVDRAVTPGDAFLYLPDEKLADHWRSAREPDLRSR